MSTHVSATALEETPHETETNQITISDALRRRALSVINDRRTDPQWRSIVRYALEINDPWLADVVRLMWRSFPGVKRIRVESNLKVDRRDFGISWSRVMQYGGLFVGNEVNLEINIEAIVRSPSQRTRDLELL